MAPGLLWLAIFFVLPNIQMVPMSLSRGPSARASSSPGTLTTTPSAFERLPGQLPELAPVRRPGDASCVPDRLPAGLWDRVPGRALQDHPAVPRHRAVLHELPDPDDLVADPPRRGRAGPGGPPRGPRHRSRRTSTSSTRPLAVVSGLTYQFLPFMVLPLYVALEKVDLRLVEAATRPVRRPVATRRGDRRRDRRGACSPVAVLRSSATPRSRPAGSSGPPRPSSAARRSVASSARS